MSERVACPACGAPLVEGARFCGSCGRSLPSSPVCRQCGAVSSRGAKFCRGCGAVLPQLAKPRGELQPPAVAGVEIPRSCAPRVHARHRQTGCDNGGKDSRCRTAGQTVGAGRDCAVAAGAGRRGRPQPCRRCAAVVERRAPRCGAQALRWRLRRRPRPRGRPASTALRKRSAIPPARGWMFPLVRSSTLRP